MFVKEVNFTEETVSLDNCILATSSDIMLLTS